MTKEIKLGSFKFSKILAEKSEDFKGKLTIKPNIHIKSIENSKNEALKVSFNFEVNYGDLGKVLIEGRFHILADKETSKDLLKGWKDKNLDENINLILVNLIMQKCSVKALALEDELSLPPHVQLPRLQFNKK